MEREPVAIAASTISSGEAASWSRSSSLARFGDVPVLAEFAGQVAPGSAERQHGSSGQIVVKWLLLYWIDTESRGAAVGREHDPVIQPATHEAQAALAFVKPAISRADIALDAPVFEPVPVAARNTFQTLGFGHGIRRVDTLGKPQPFANGRDGELPRCLAGPPTSKSARGRRLILFLMGGDGKPNRRHSRPLRPKSAPGAAALLFPAELHLIFGARQAKSPAGSSLVVAGSLSWSGMS